MRPVMDEATYERFDSSAGFNAAVERLLAQPGRELRIFDPDGSALRLNDSARIESLERFLNASRTRRIYMVLHDAEHLKRHCPRMPGLLARSGLLFCCERCATMMCFSFERSSAPRRRAACWLSRWPNGPAMRSFSQRG